MKKEPKVTIGFYKGATSFFIDGKVQPCTSFKITETSDTKAMLKSAEIEIPGIVKQGIMNCWVPVFVDWQGPDKYDFSDFDKRIETILKIYDKNIQYKEQKSFIAVRVQAAVFSPLWYINKFCDKNGNPTNLIEFHNRWGNVELTGNCVSNKFTTVHRDYDSTYAISPGDEFWDTYALDCLDAIVRHVKEKWYSNRIFAWLPCAFNSNEWFIRTDAPEATCDFSEPTQRAFHKYLKNKGIFCNEYPVPLPLDCYRKNNVFLNQKKKGEKIIEEFSIWLNYRISEIILNFARVIKKHYIDNSILVGFFYGYTNELSSSHNLAQSGHLNLKSLLDSPEIDFFCSPCQYKYRPDESPFTYNQVLGAFANSAGICGKLCFAEDDHRPVFVKSSNSMFLTRDEWHDEMFFRRNFSQVITQGQHMWWYSLGPEWFREKKRQKIIGKLHDIGIKVMNIDRSAVAEVAVIVDESSILAMYLDPELQKMLILESYSQCCASGVPVEYYELNSFLKYVDPSRFKVLIFLNLFLVNKTIEDGIKKLKSKNRTLIFQYAPGFVRENHNERIFSILSACRLTGINLKKERDLQPLIVWIDSERTDFIPKTRDIRYGFSVSKQVKPIFSAIDEKAEILGYLYSGNPGLIRKKHKNWTSIFTSVPCLPSEVLNLLFRDAGVHVYTKPKDVIYVCKSLIAFVSSLPQIKQLIMPGDTSLTDIFTGRTIYPNKNGIYEFFAKRHEVRMFWRNV